MLHLYPRKKYHMRANLLMHFPPKRFFSKTGSKLSVNFNP